MSQIVGGRFFPAGPGSIVRVMLSAAGRGHWGRRGRSPSHGREAVGREKNRRYNSASRPLWENGRERGTRGF